MREKPDHIIWHVRTNDLNSNRLPNLTAKSIVDLAITQKNNSQNVSVSNIVITNDNFNDKVMETVIKAIPSWKEYFFDKPYQNNLFKKD